MSTPSNVGGAKRQRFPIPGAGVSTGGGGAEAGNNSTEMVSAADQKPVAHIEVRGTGDS